MLVVIRTFASPMQPGGGPGVTYWRNSFAAMFGVLGSLVLTLDGRRRVATIVVFVHIT